MAEEAWYQSLREQWKPSHVRLLLVGESAPDDGGDPNSRRFFYSEPLNQADNLFRSVVAALYDGGKLTKGDLKEPWLMRLRDEGVYLIDLASRPVNALPPAMRRTALKECIDDCVQRVRDLNPDGIVICHAPTFALLVGPFKAASLPLLHDEAIPFPLGNKRREFAEKVRQAVAGLPGLSTPIWKPSQRSHLSGGQPQPDAGSLPATCMGEDSSRHHYG